MSLMAEIDEQGCKARNRVREIKKMRQYFQREGHVQGQPLGQAAVRDREHVKKEGATEDGAMFLLAF